MAIWTAKCWLGSSEGYQDLEVKSNTWEGAKNQLERVYGAEQIINLRQVNSNTNSSSGESSGLGGLAVLAIGGWLAWEAWKLGSTIVIAAWQWIVSAAQWFMGLFSWIPFMSPQLLVGLVFGFFFLVLILAALDD